MDGVFHLHRFKHGYGVRRSDRIAYFHVDGYYHAGEGFNSVAAGFDLRFVDDLRSAFGARCGRGAGVR